MSGYFSHRTLSSSVMFTSGWFSKKSVLDITGITDMAQTRLCEWLDYDTPLALFTHAPSMSTRDFTFYLFFF